MVSESNQVHLHVLLHGLWGTPAHLSEVEKVFKQHLADTKAETTAGVQVEVLLIGGNVGKTYDGIDFGAEVATDEVSDDTVRMAE